MGILEILDWQWSSYGVAHRSRANLLIHIVAVPLFMAGSLAAVAAFIWLSLAWAVAGVGAMVLSLALQGRGHKGEVTAPAPFSSPANAVARIFLEQWINFPRFVLTGRWFRAWASAADPAYSNGSS
ncbi:hypothetical protein [Parvibaculum sp.]|uniref:hypothetical protein n=1 Tax=Parvibaculum sp. TaxID=2024848 RepID=UPI002C9A4BA6|nr:hypothetical protein [Parvibaculum sp.]HUD51001.1 hypothetical protein [Parvibaculum sp.]